MEEGKLVEGGGVTIVQEVVYFLLCRHSQARHYSGLNLIALSILGKLAVVEVKKGMQSHDSRQRGYPREARYYPDLYLVVPSIIGKLTIVEMKDWKRDAKS
jgi:hypothetical protein